jgi:predicted nucleotidyltransferase
VSEVILQGVVGSTAYGLAREGSDVDMLGIFVAPTLEVAGLDWNTHKESKVTTDPDVTLHEVGKYLRLSLSGNPTIYDLLYLPNESYVVKTHFGQMLIDMRYELLSEKTVRNSYGGYARQQVTKLKNRGDGSYSADTRKRTAKHSRHLLRLLRQGRELLETGNLTVKVANPEEYFAIDDMTVDEILAMYEHEDKLFMATKSVLPERPNKEAVRELLNEIRRTYV